MNQTVRIGAEVEVEARSDTVFAAATDWDRQGEWMLGTTVRVRRGDGHSVGSELEAVTGIAGIGVADRMQITLWDAPARCEMRHLGKVVRGIGIFAVRPRGRDAATFEWIEQLELPWGMLGRAAWPLVKPFFGWGLRFSLDRFAGFCRT
ncbi:MAG TPA: SRPBCC family protein, partial [Pseudonocardiaceae bacterium]|nr:SRPBCC family protein [Pseudonocardiaceae bacterium]